ncbi:MAG: NUDIX domain-containing protein [Parcubacteria group bacterium]|jgi:8-oxo-dGTP pyrophosphatase MutT (NUDIX family)
MKKVICIDRNGDKHEVSAEELVFRPAVYGVIIKDGKILLSKQWDGFDFPGGKIELGEDIKSALIREVKEETGMDVKVGRVVACENSFYKTLPGDSRKGDALHSMLVYYLCEIVSGELSIENIDIHEKDYISMPEWISLENTDKIKFYNSIDSLEIIKKALEICIT